MNRYLIATSHHAEVNAALTARPLARSAVEVLDRSLSGGWSIIRIMRDDVEIDEATLRRDADVERLALN